MPQPPPITCPACGQTNSRIIAKDFPGYVQGTTFDIAECPDCRLSFIFPLKVSEGVYNIIYGQKAMPGYDRYRQLAQTVKRHPHPLSYLSRQAYPYQAIAEYVARQPKMRILDVGCGYGYLSYALRQAGHGVIGIDVSAKAISKAKSLFGGEFSPVKLEDYAKGRPKPFQLIIATEIIEHLTNLSVFFLAAKELLEPGGVLLITTPDKDHYPASAIWTRELPPVHSLFFTQTTLKQLAKRLDFHFQAVRPRGFILTPANLLALHVFTHWFSSEQPVLNSNGQPLMPANLVDTRRALIAASGWRPIQLISNCLFFLLKKRPLKLESLVVIFQKPYGIKHNVD